MFFVCFHAEARGLILHFEKISSAGSKVNCQPGLQVLPRKTNSPKENFCYELEGLSSSIGLHCWMWLPHLAIYRWFSPLLLFITLLSTIVVLLLLHVTLRIHIFLWLLAQNRLVTMNNLKKRNMNKPEDCIRLSLSVYLLFIGCIVASQFWLEIAIFF
jgi:hypothetical protein